MSIREALAELYSHVRVDPRAKWHPAWEAARAALAAQPAQDALKLPDWPMAQQFKSAADVLATLEAAKSDRPQSFALVAACWIAAHWLKNGAAQPAQAPVAWVGVGCITGKPIFAQADELRSEECEPWKPLFAAPVAQPAQPTTTAPADPFLAGISYPPDAPTRR